MAGLPSGDWPRMISPKAIGFIALAGAVIGYGGLWPVTRLAIETIPPFWFASMRMWIGIAILVGILLATGRLRMPTRHDVPLILSIGFLMMAFYTTLMHIALQYVEAGRAALLGYTTPLWVLPAAYFLLGEKPSRRKVAGMIVAMAGLGILFNPLAFDWSDGNVVLGNALLLLCAILWSITIIHIRAHRPMLTPIQLAPFQLGIAATFIMVMALIFDPLPSLDLSAAEFGLFAYGSTFGTALAMMSVTTCVRYLPTTVSTVGLLGAPVCALLLSVIFLDEQLTRDLAGGVILIVGGIALVSLPDRKAVRAAD
jgi:drug/metabolite transporter (DMT)-like permease